MLYPFWRLHSYALGQLSLSILNGIAISSSIAWKSAWKNLALPEKGMLELSKPLNTVGKDQDQIRSHSWAQATPRGQSRSDLGCCQGLLPEESIHSGSWVWCDHPWRYEVPTCHWYYHPLHQSHEYTLLEACTIKASLGIPPIRAHFHLEIAELSGKIVAFGVVAALEGNRFTMRRDLPYPTTFTWWRFDCTHQELIVIVEGQPSACQNPK